MKTISSQRLLDDSIVSEKLTAGDFEVSVSPSFKIDGETYRVIMDGHHSLEAAKLAGEEPNFVEIDVQDCDKIYLLDRGDIEEFLLQSWMDSDYYDVETGVSVW